MKASLPIPNDDPNCKCRILQPDEEIPADVKAIAGLGPTGVDFRIALDLQCPFHGELAHALGSELRRGDFTLGTFSAETGQPVHFEPIPARSAVVAKIPIAYPVVTIDRHGGLELVFADGDQAGVFARWFRGPGWMAFCAYLDR